MRIAGLLGLAVLIITGCSEPTAAHVASPARVSTSPAGTATPSPPAGPWAVMVGGGGGGPYIVQLVTFDGRGGPFAQAMSRSIKQYWFPPSPCAQARCPEGETAAYTMPEISISNTHVYFLDGESVVKSLSSDGSVQTVMTISAPDNSQVVFAVSPDDQRIAVSIITLARSRIPASFNDVMYVEDIGTGANRVDIYSSTTIGEWPIGWHAGHLIVGVGGADLFGFENPYGAIGYHIADPATGLRLGALDCARGLLVAAGTACASGWCSTGSTCGSGTLGKQAWDGTKTAFDIPSGPPPKIFMAFANAAELSPDGASIATSAVADQQTFAVETLLFKNGSSSILTQLGSPLGWLDSSRLLVSSPSAVWVIDVNTRITTQMTNLQTIPQTGMRALAGVMPTDLR
jgi:hypothetical protein